MLLFNVLHFSSAELDDRHHEMHKLKEAEGQELSYNLFMFSNCF
jgi:hypothetical protein